MNLRYFDIAWMSGHDGPGKRVVLYFQQCHLRCEWCHSPHSWEYNPPVMFFENRCGRCGRCARACGQSVHKVDRKSHILFRHLCVRCGDCILACPASSGDYGSSALQLPAREADVAKLFFLLSPQLKLVEDIGGLTLSGGEALLQHEAAHELLTLCRDNGFHSALETSGTLPLSTYQYMSDLVDCWLFGLRPANPEGDLPDSALENLEYLASLDAPVIIRLPVIDDCTTRREILEKTSLAMSSHDLDEIQLLPYNPDASHYYRALGIEYPGDNRFSVSKEQVQYVKGYFKDKNMKVTII